MPPPRELFVTESMLLRALSQRYHPRLSGREYLFFAGVMTGPTQGAGSRLSIFDAVAIARSWAQPEVIGFEVKCSRSDFLRDTKWPRYLDYCHRFYWVCPTGLIRPEEVDERTGLLWYDPVAKRLHTRCKVPYRAVEIPSTFWRYLVFSRLEPDRHPFWSDRREQLAAWVADREERLDLGQQLKGKIKRVLVEQQKRIDALTVDVERMQGEHDALERLRDLLRDHGLPIYGGGVAEQLHAALTAGVSPQTRRAARDLARAAEHLAELIEETGGLA